MGSVSTAAYASDGVVAPDSQAQVVNVPTDQIDAPEGNMRLLTTLAATAKNGVVTAALHTEVVGEFINTSAISKLDVVVARTSSGAKLVAAKWNALTYSWNDGQMSCLNTLWTQESHWNFKARNKRSGAYGIPQANPGTKMEAIGSDWRTNPVTQIKWGMSYVKSRYGTPCSALKKSKNSGWY